ncbi:hypothetical protein HPB48_002234 [Haemaphysalis longicornis]|uniref:Uncharacterized protein n=1 Tax=Haemaphysalis longicornis TaxID=44386 RepID=A0A9J6FII9_HAELO|nr:hypothetical protein HPB48_002234 [Haemaphysalis longicornis]
MELGANVVCRTVKNLPGLFAREKGFGYKGSTFHGPGHSEIHVQRCGLDQSQRDQRQVHPREHVSGRELRLERIGLGILSIENAGRKRTVSKLSFSSPTVQDSSWWTGRKIGGAQPRRRGHQEGRELRFVTIQEDRHQRKRAFVRSTLFEYSRYPATPVFVFFF